MKKSSLLLTISLLCGGLLIAIFPFRIFFFMSYILGGFHISDEQAIMSIFSAVIFVPGIFLGGIVIIIVGMFELNAYMKWRKSLNSNPY